MNFDKPIESVISDEESVLENWCNNTPLLKKHGSQSIGNLSIEWSVD